MHLRFVLGSLSVSYIVGWSPCAYISVYWLLPTLKGIWVVYSISWRRCCCCKCSHPGSVSLTLISSQSLRVSRPLAVWELTYLVLCFFQLLYFSCSHRRAGVGTHQGFTWIFRTPWSILSILWYLCGFFLSHESFLGPWIRIRCRRHNLPQFLQVHNSYLIYRLHFDSQICLTQVHEVSLLCCLWKALHFKKCKNCATFYMSVRDHFDLMFAWVKVSCWFALVEGGGWCFQHHWLKRQSFLHWLPLCLCQNSVDCPRVGLGLLWTCPPAHCPRGSAPTDRPTWPQSQGPWSESGRPW